MEKVVVVRENFLEEVKYPGLGKTSRIYLGVKENKQEEQGSENSEYQNKRENTLIFLFACSEGSSGLDITPESF